MFCLSDLGALLNVYALFFRDTSIFPSFLFRSKLNSFICSSFKVKQVRQTQDFFSSLLCIAQHFSSSYSQYLQTTSSALGISISIFTFSTNVYIERWILLGFFIYFLGKPEIMSFSKGLFFLKYEFSLSSGSSLDCKGKVSFINYSSFFSSCTVILGDVLVSDWALVIWSSSFKAFFNFEAIYLLELFP